MKVLVLDAHANAALGVLQSLGRAGHHVHLAGESARVTSWSSRHAAERHVYPEPLTRTEAFRRWLVALHERERYDFILPVTDNTIHPLMELRRRSPIAELVLPTEDSFAWVFDKDRTLELAERVGVPVPRSVTIDPAQFDATEPRSYPLFVKPSRSKAWDGDRGHVLQPALARDAEALTACVRSFGRYGGMHAQEHVPGVGAGIGALCDRGELLVAFAYERVHEYPLTGGASTYRVSTALPDDLMQASRKLLGDIGWHGVAMVEFKRDGDRFWLMEINGRFWGSLPLALHSGVDFPRLLLEMLTGGRPEQPRYRVGCYARKIASDVAWFKQNLRADRSDPFLLTRPVGRTLLEGLRVLYGRERWDHASLGDPMPVLRDVATVVARELKLGLGRLGKRPGHEAL